MYSERNYTLPIYAVLEIRANWQVRMDRDGQPNGPTFLFEIPKPLPAVGERSTPPGLILARLDAFDVRNDFLSLKTPENALVFFRDYGPWQVKERYAMEAAPFTWSQVQRMREFFEDALVASPGQGGTEIRETLESMWMWGNLPLELPFQEPLVAFTRCDDIQTALRASVYLSRLAGLQWNRCAKTDCNKLFQRNSKREQLYCCTEHANVQSTRNYKQRKSAAVKRTSKTKGKAAAKSSTGAGR